MGERRREDKEELQVKDRRRYNPDGTPRQGSERVNRPEEVPQESSTAKETPPSAEVEEDHDEPDSPEREMEINFSTFLLSLASSVQISLGLIPHPVSRKPEINLISAKQTIDILGMLADKTKGNLSQEEDHLIKQILYELRMIYVDLANKIQKGKPS